MRSLLVYVSNQRRLRTIRLLAILLSALTLGVHPAVQHHQHHTKGCTTHACDVRVGRAWAKKHQPHFKFGSFELCVANREQGEPGSTDFHYINWQARQGRYGGAYSMEQSKWEAGGGLHYASVPEEASPEEQTLVFRKLGKMGEWTASNWPTIPPCGG